MKQKENTHLWRIYGGNITETKKK